MSATRALDRMWRTEVTNCKTGGTTVGFSGLTFVEEAVAATLRRAEATTPLEQLPTAWTITVSMITETKGSRSHGMDEHRRPRAS